MSAIPTGITAVVFHGRARACERPRSRTRSTSSARTCSSSRRAARANCLNQGYGGGFGSASTLATCQDAARRPWPTAPDVQTGRTCIHDVGRTALRWSTNWTTMLTGTTPRGSEVRSRGVSDRTVHHGGRRGERGARRRVGPIPHPALRGQPERRRTGRQSTTASRSRSSACSTVLSIVRERIQQRPGRRAAQRATSNGSSAGEPELGQPIYVKGAFVRPALGRVPGRRTHSASNTAPCDEPVGT